MMITDLIDERINNRLVMVSSPAAATGIHLRSSKRNVIFALIISSLKQLPLLLLLAAMAYGAYVFASHYVMKSVQVVGVSMVPTLQENNRYLMDLVTFQRRQPRVNDIVVIRDPGDHGLSVKRIIATEGESVHFKDGKVFVNGQQLNEPYLLPHTMTFTYAQAKEQLITCGKGQFFVLGDNRLRSIDSRSYGPVPREAVLGLVK